MKQSYSWCCFAEPYHLPSSTTGTLHKFNLLNRSMKPFNSCKCLMCSLWIEQLGFWLKQSASKVHALFIFSAFVCLFFKYSNPTKTMITAYIHPVFSSGFFHLSLVQTLVVWMLMAGYFATKGIITPPYFFAL